VAIIQHVTHDGPAWAWVSSFGRHENGRAACLALKAQHSGDSFTTRVVTKADTTIEGLCFDGKSKSYPLEKFCEQLNKAYTDLDDNGEPLTEAKKVQRLLQSIRDPRLEAAKSTIMVSAAHRENLTAAMSHLVKALDMIKTTTVGTRTTPTTHTHGGWGQGRGRGHGRGRGSARGGRFGRGGRGRGGLGASAFDPNDPGKSYSPVDWTTLSPEEQARCRAARGENPGGGATPSLAGDLGTIPEAGAPAPAPAPSGGHGPGVGRGRHG